MASDTRTEDDITTNATPSVERTPRTVMWDMRDNDANGYIPVAFTEGQAGYSPMTGNGPYAVPWYWGDTPEQCQFYCDQFNEEMGIDRETAMGIILDCFRITMRYKEWVRDYAPDAYKMMQA